MSWKCKLPYDTNTDFHSTPYRKNSFMNTLTDLLRRFWKLTQAWFRIYGLAAVNRSNVTFLSNHATIMPTNWFIYVLINSLSRSLILFICLFSLSINLFIKWILTCQNILSSFPSCLAIFFCMNMQLGEWNKKLEVHVTTHFSRLDYQ